MKIKRTMRILVGLCAVFALTAGVATATAGGDPAKKPCSKGGWQMLYGVDPPEFVPTFTGSKDCVSFASHGTLKMRFGSVVDCANLGGNYVTDPDVPVWQCLGVHYTDQATATAANQLLIADCYGEGSNMYTAVGNGDTLDAHCWPYSSG
jgi:hypothetical protein